MDIILISALEDPLPHFEHSGQPAQHMPHIVTLDVDEFGISQAVKEYLANVTCCPVEIASSEASEYTAGTYIIEAVDGAEPLINVKYAHYESKWGWLGAKLTKVVRDIGHFRYVKLAARDEEVQQLRAKLSIARAHIGELKTIQAENIEKISELQEKIRTAKILLDVCRSSSAESLTVANAIIKSREDELTEIALVAEKQQIRIEQQQRDLETARGEIAPRSDILNEIKTFDSSVLRPAEKKITSDETTPLLI